MILKFLNPRGKIFVGLSEGSKRHVGVRVSAVLGTLTVEQPTNRLEFVSEFLFGEDGLTHLAIKYRWHCYGNIFPI